MYNTHLDFHTFSDARSALCSASSVWLCAVVLGRSAEQRHTSLTAFLSCSDHSVSPPCLPRPQYSILTAGRRPLLGT